VDEAIRVRNWSQSTILLTFDYD